MGTTSRIYLRIAALAALTRSEGDNEQFLLQSTGNETGYLL